MLQDDRKEELERVLQETAGGDRPPGTMMAQFTARCAEDAEGVLKAAKSVMCAVLVHSRDRWPPDDEWRSVLPEWFVSRCAKEKSEDEARTWLEWWRTLPHEQRAIASRENWSLSNWVAWFEPDERQWIWWGAWIEGPNSIRVTVAVDGLPFAWGALEWLFLASGAESMSLEE